MDRPSPSRGHVLLAPEGRSEEVAHFVVGPAEAGGAGVDLETPHRPEAPFYPSVILFQMVVEVLGRASSSCWARSESWTCLRAHRGAAGYAACSMPQTWCHAWKARARSARSSVAGMRWRGRRKRLLIGSWADRK